MRETSPTWPLALLTLAWVVAVLATSAVVAAAAARREPAAAGLGGSTPAW